MFWSVADSDSKTMADILQPTEALQTIKTSDDSGEGSRDKSGHS